MARGAAPERQDVRLAICGLGLVGRRHVEAIAACPGATLVGAVEPGADGRAYAADRDIPVHASVDALIETARPDGVILATPTRLHTQQALALIAADIPVLIEKPIADTCASAAAVVAAAGARGVPVAVGHHRRHNPLIAAAHEAIAAGRIGDIRAVHATCWFYKPDHYFDAAPWRTRTGAGPISVNLVHDVDLLRHLCGEIVSVRAEAAASRRGFENEDVAAAVLRFASGAIGTITVSDSIVAPWSWEMTSAEVPIYPHLPESCYLIGGSHGALSLPDLRIWTHADGGRDWWTPMSAAPIAHRATDPLVNQIAQFAEVIRGQAPPLVPAAEGFRSLQVIEAIQAAAATGEAVTLAPGGPTETSHTERSRA